MSHPVILFVAPHLSTGGMPQYLLQVVSELSETHEVHVAEWQDYGRAYVVQRAQLDALLGDRLYALGGDPAALLYVLERVRPDVLHFQEIPEMFLPMELLKQIYDSALRPATIIETSHSSLPEASASKRFLPDRFVLVSPFQRELFASHGVPCEVREYVAPIQERPDRMAALQALGLDPACRHVLHVGLFTPWKNQGEVIDMAKRFVDEPVVFHFVGNMAENFAEYWRPLVESLPKNCVTWGERSDVAAFYAAMDLFVFPSQVECNPLVVKEARAWGMPVLMRELLTYRGMTFDAGVEFLQADTAINDAAVRRLSGLPERAPVRIVMFSDAGYEYQIAALLESLDMVCPASVPRVYYTVGFESSLERPNLTKVVWPLDARKPRFDFYKPGLLLDALRRFGAGHYVYLDSDVVVSRRFDLDSLVHGHDYPMMSVGNWDYPFSFRYEGDTRVQFDHTKLMQYFNVPAATMTYVSGCFLSFNGLCEDLFREWKAVVENDYLLSEAHSFFPFHDETALNVVLWRRGVSQSYGRVFLNTINATAAIEVETRDDIRDVRALFDNPLQRCDDSSRVRFYHGMKDPVELGTVLAHLKQRPGQPIMTPKRTSVGIHAVFNDSTGYGVLSTGFADALSTHLPVRRNAVGDVNVTFADAVSVLGIRERHPWPSILYNAWETTRYPDGFVEALQRYDYLWVPSEWQRHCSIEQGIDPAMVQVVPGGVDPERYMPGEVTSCEPFTFLLVAKWEPRKSNREICEAFRRAFPLEQYPQVRLQLSCDTNYPCDNYRSTEERLVAYGLRDPRFEIVHHESRARYVRRMQRAHVFISCARAEGWGLPIIEAMACGVPTIVADWSGPTQFAQNAIKVPIKELRAPGGVVDGYNNAAATTMMNAPGQWAEPDFEELTRLLRDTYDHYGERRIAALAESERIRRDFSWDAAARAAQAALEALPRTRPQRPNLIPVRARPADNFKCSFVRGAHVHCWGVSDDRYEVKFNDHATGRNIYTTVLTPGTWAVANALYFVDWEVVVTHMRTGTEVHRERQDFKGRRVLIALETKALGDTLAWFPYAEAFREKHGCEVIVSTFWNHLFREHYPELTFVEPGTDVHNLSGHYYIGWVYRDGKPDVGGHHPTDFIDQPLQKTATDILGLEFNELRAKVAVDATLRPKGIGFVGVGVQSTMQTKYWNRKGGWDELVDGLLEEGKRVLVMSNEPNGYMGNKYPKGAIRLPDYNIGRVVATMSGLECFVGVCSGLAWLAWTLGVPTVVIEGASSDHTMPSDVVRVHSRDDVCKHCFLRAQFDKGEWYWCPDHQKDNRKFECTATITAAEVRAAMPGPRRSPTGRDGVIIQFAEGALHLGILEMVRPQHQAYADQHGFDLQVIEAPGPVMAAYGWLRWQYILDAFNAGYTHAVLLETDQLIQDFSTDLRDATVTRPLAMWYADVPGAPPHYQTGAIYARNTPEVRAFIDELMDLCPANDVPEENYTWWARQYCQQTEANRLLRTTRWSTQVTPLDARWNCLHDDLDHPGGPAVPNPIVGGWHGARRESDKRDLMRQAMEPRYLVTAPDAAVLVGLAPRTGTRAIAAVVESVAGEGDYVVCTFTGAGPHVQINGPSAEEYRITFVNQLTGRTEYSTVIHPGEWARADTAYYVPWLIHVIQVRTWAVLHRERFDCEGRKGYIVINPTGLGDTLAFIPYVEAFRQKHGCRVVVSTYWNHLFEQTYPDLAFVAPGTVVEDAYFVIHLSHWFTEHGTDYRFHRSDHLDPAHRFQRTAADILGLEFEELRPKLLVDAGLYPRRPGLVGIGFHTTIQFKYWNNPTGWTELVNWLRAEGKEVLLLSNEPDGCPRGMPRFEDYPGVLDVPGNVPPPGLERLPSHEIERVIAAVSACELFVGVNSGLSWLAWALGVPTVIIDGISGGCLPSEVAEVVPHPSVCRFCTRRGIHHAEWDACPSHYRTERAFECTKSITGARVIDTVDRLQRTQACPRLGTIHVRDDAQWGQDVDAVDDVLWHDCYDLKSLRARGLDAKIVLDVGGHVGSFGMRVCELWPTARVFAFEPDPVSGALYRRNVPEAVVFDGAVTYDPRPLALVRDARSTGSARLYDTGADGTVMPGEEGVWSLARVEVPKTTLEETMGIHGLTYIDILKLDCEGSEYSILEHMRVETAARIGLIVGEYHQEGNQRFTQLHALLSRRFPTWSLRLLAGPNGGPCVPYQGNFIAGPAALIGGE